MTLKSEPRIDAPDDFYAALLALHDGMTEAQSRLINARLILLLANQVGDMETLRAAMAEACRGIEPEGIESDDSDETYSAIRTMTS